ncbi:hypothetical protein J2X57_003758 [Luteibacter sp. 1214]|uniref:hypothetical protein n=1 Tax=Luteibacter sp. 1214 TaxID=2817735 RepID=UPI00286724E7|nr:hypothetical protein [Luteibacter sp. 1214]MDR6644515.1 hypothetical protein [Luteibacter sp. 1214]
MLLVGALAVAVSQIRPADDWIHILGTLSIAVGFVAAFGILPTLMTRDLVRTADGALRLGADQCGSLVRAYGHDAYGQTELVGDS